MVAWLGRSKKFAIRRGDTSRAHYLFAGRLANVFLFSFRPPCSPVATTNVIPATFLRSRLVFDNNGLADERGGKKLINGWKSLPRKTGIQFSARTIVNGADLNETRLRLVDNSAVTAGSPASGTQHGRFIGQTLRPNTFYTHWSNALSKCLSLVYKLLYSNANTSERARSGDTSFLLSNCSW